MDPDLHDASDEADFLRRAAAPAIADLAQRLSIPEALITVLEVRAVAWPDASLGCPQPGMEYAQVIQPGRLMRLEAGGRVYAYHAGRSGRPFLCEQAGKPPPDAFAPPAPGFRID